MASPNPVSRRDEEVVRASPDNTPAVSELSELVHLLSEAERRLTSSLAEALASEATTVAQWHVLSLLADEAAHPMRAVAAYTLLPAASATRLVDGMVRDGLVQRASDAQDRRLVLVQISALGRARHRGLAARIERRREAILAAADAARLRRLAERMSAAVDRCPMPSAAPNAATGCNPGAN
jgi:DNA-binding MarR family transcriptional regulator